jgi:hypothetical protein
VEKESVLKFMELLSDKDKIADFIVHQQLAITGLTQNNEAFSEAFRASESAELSATDSQQINDKIALKLEYIMVRLQHNTGTEWKYECMQAANECLALLHH